MSADIGAAVSDHASFAPWRVELLNSPLETGSPLTPSSAVSSDRCHKAAPVMSVSMGCGILMSNHLQIECQQYQPFVQNRRARPWANSLTETFILD